MRTIHLVDVQDLIHVQVLSQPEHHSFCSGVTIKASRLRRLLESVRTSDIIVFVMPADPAFVSDRGLPSHVQTLKHSTVKRIPLASVDRLQLQEWMRFIFRSKEQLLYVAEWDTRPDDRAMDASRVQWLNASHPLPDGKVRPYSGSLPPHAVYYSSDKDFAERYKCLCTSAESRRFVPLAAPAQVWPAEHEALMAGVEDGSVAQLVIDSDSLLMSNWGAVIDDNIRRQCDGIYLKLREAIRKPMSDYPLRAPAQKRFAYLKKHLLLSSRYLNDDVYNSLYQQCLGLHCVELHGARLDAWFNQFRAGLSRLNPGMLSKLEAFYQRADWSARERALISMLVNSVEKATPDSPMDTFLKHQLHKLCMLSQKLFYRVPINRNVRAMIDHANRHRVAVHMTRAVEPPLDDSIFSLKAAAVSLSGSSVHKPDAQLMRLGESMMSLSGELSRSDLGYKNTSVMYFTLRMIFSGQKSVKLQKLYVVSSIAEQTHPFLLLQCNALLKSCAMNLEWHSAAVCHGAEPLSHGAACAEHLELSASHASVYCNPLDMFKRIRTLFARETASRTRVDMGEFDRIYLQAWQQVGALERARVSGGAAVTRARRHRPSLRESHFMAGSRRKPPTSAAKAAKHAVVVGASAAAKPTPKADQSGAVAVRTMTVTDTASLFADLDRQRASSARQEAGSPLPPGMQSLDDITDLMRSGALLLPADDTHDDDSTKADRDKASQKYG